MVTAWLNWSLDVECPNCKESLDLNDGSYDGYGDIAIAIFTNNWSALNGHEITCEFCETDFVLEKIEY